MLTLQNVTKRYRLGSRSLTAVDGVSLEIHSGEVLGVIGASGSGKSTVGRLALGLERPTFGSIHFEGRSLATLNRAQRRALRKEMQIVFQDPAAALNPRMTVQDLVAEGLDIHGMARGAKRLPRVQKLLHLVGLGNECLHRFPHEFSGGQRQRICIARALAVRPRLLVLDEPLSALDLSIQAQVVSLLKSLQEQMDLTYLFIAHDLSMVRYLADRIAVMHQGQLVELASTDTLFATPQHAHTRALMAAK